MCRGANLWVSGRRDVGLVHVNFQLLLFSGRKRLTEWDSENMHFYRPVQQHGGRPLAT
jgi:hypothetical protein